MKKLLLSLVALASIGSIAAFDQRLVDNAISKNPAQKAEIQRLAGEIKNLEKTIEWEQKKGFGKSDLNYVGQLTNTIQFYTDKIKQLGNAGIEENWYEL